MTLRRVLIGAGIVVALPVLGLAVLSVFSRRGSTTGLMNGRLRECPDSPNCVCSQGRESHRIAPLRYSGSSVSAWEKLKQVIRNMPRTRIVKDEDGYLHATFESAVFRFIDDVEFQLSPVEGVINVRSASRVGHSDLGVNRRRVEVLRAELNRMLELHP